VPRKSAGREASAYLVSYVTKYHSPTVTNVGRVKNILLTQKNCLSFVSVLGKGQNYNLWEQEQRRAQLWRCRFT
jgi:hypothetical protein